MRISMFPVLIIMAASTIADPVISASLIIKYSDFRKVLIKKKWSPVIQDKSNTNEFPEVLCGLGPDALCSAMWSEDNGRLSEVDVGYDKRKSSKTVGELITSKTIHHLSK